MSDRTTFGTSSSFLKELFIFYVLRLQIEVNELVIKNGFGFVDELFQSYYQVRLLHVLN
jgi:hypothetical protein